MFEVVGIVHEEAQITLPLLVDFVDDCVNVVKVRTKDPVLFRSGEQRFQVWLNHKSVTMSLDMKTI